jgi:hypothetical protein
MNEEQAALHFFSQPENLPLTLTLADKIDELRRDMNNQFWQQLHHHLSNKYANWEAIITEHRDEEERIVGIHLQPKAEQILFLRPMMEQQLMGETLRIYLGLMWNREPAADKTQLPDVVTLHNALQQSGFKHNTNFLGWRWSNLHPQRKDFLLRFAKQPQELIDEATALFDTMLAHDALLQSANAALYNAPRSMNISLDLLHKNSGD